MHFFQAKNGRQLVFLHVKCVGKESDLPTHHISLFQTSTTARVGMHLKRMISQHFNYLLIFYLCSSYQPNALFSFYNIPSLLVSAGSSTPFISAMVD